MRFVQRVINSPQTSCQSAKQASLQMSRECRGERVAVHRAAGKLFQIIGPVTANLILSVVFVLGTDSNPMPAECRRRLSAMAEIARQPGTSAPVHVRTCKHGPGDSGGD